MIETRLLQYFLALAKEQSITKAAQALHISQPALSRQLMELEQQIGKPLFLRGKKSITLTDDGKLLRDNAVRILDLINQTEQLLAAEHDPIDGDIHLGCCEVSIPNPVLHVCGQMRQQHPTCRIHVQLESLEAIAEQLHSGRLDMALVFDPTTHTRFHCIPLSIQDQWGLLFPEDSPLARADHVTFTNMRQVPLIYPQRIYRNLRHPSGFTLDNRELNIAATYDQISTAVQMTKAGLGYTYCLRDAASREATDHLTFRPLQPTFTATMYILLRKDTVLSPAAQIFLEFLLKYT